jgi:DNA invertase Pin-like site-specific DNA recombinase
MTVRKAALARKRDTSRPILAGLGGSVHLTPRQAEVLELAARGLGDKEIAAYLGISRRTIEDRFAEMRERTGTRTRAELVARAVEAGLVRPVSGVPPADPTAGTGRSRGLSERHDAGKLSFLNTSGDGRQTGASRHDPVYGKGVEKPACPITPLGPILEQAPAMAMPSRPAAPLPESTAPADGAPPGALIGYARASATGQNLDRQIRVLNEAGCILVFTDRQPGKTADRQELEACLDYLRPGDVLVVASLDRLSRSLHELITIVAGLRRHEHGFRSLHEDLDTTTPGGRLVFHVFVALAEFIRELIVQGTHEGIAAARARGVRLGRPPAMTPEQIQHARALLAQPDNTVSSIARLLGVSRSTIYKYVPELAGGSSALGASASNPLPESDAAGPCLL